MPKRKSKTTPKESFTGIDDARRLRLIEERKERELDREALASIKSKEAFATTSSEKLTLKGAFAYTRQKQPTT